MLTRPVLYSRELFLQEWSVWGLLAVLMLEIKISRCFSFFSTDCLKNNSEGLSNSTEEFLDLFNKSLTCFEHNLQVFMLLI